MDDDEWLECALCEDEFLADEPGSSMCASGEDICARCTRGLVATGQMQERE